MENEAEYIPKSAKIKFTIQFTDDTKTRAPQRVNELETEAKAAVDAFQAAAKQVIINSCKLEQATLHKAIQDACCKTIYQIIKSRLASVGHSDENPHLVFANLLAHVALDDLLEAIPNLTRQQLATHYRIINSVPSLPNAVQYPSEPHDDASDEERAATLQAQYQVQQLPSMIHIQDLTTKLKDVILHPWTAYIQQHDENQRLLAVKKVATELKTADSSEATSMEIDQEAPLSAKQMTDLINTAVKKATQPLQAQLNQLQSAQSNSPKNNKRGPKKGASKKKSKGSNRSRSPSINSRSSTGTNHSSQSSRNNKKKGKNKPRGRRNTVEDNNSASSRSNSRKPTRRPRSKSKKGSNRRNNNYNRRNNK